MKFFCSAAPLSQQPQLRILRSLQLVDQTFVTSDRFSSTVQFGDPELHVTVGVGIFLVSKLEFILDFNGWLSPQAQNPITARCLKRTSLRFSMAHPGKKAAVLERMGRFSRNFALNHEKHQRKQKSTRNQNGEKVRVRKLLDAPISVCELDCFRFAIA